MIVDVVLVRSEYSSNVGATARAMANMGASRLILINKQCEINESARMGAAGAQRHLQELVEYSTWDEFFKVEGSGIRIAMTRRSGRQRKVLPLKETLSELSHEVVTNGRLYLIFGPEADGLDATDLGFVNFCCHLPTFGDFSSMNLAQAALLSLYIVQDQFAITSQDPNTEPVAPLYFPDKVIREWLVAMGFDIDARKSSAYLTLKRLLLQNQPTRHEVQVLEAILNQNVRKLNERNTLTKETTCDEKSD